MDIPDDWLPTPANINALPEPPRRYIHDLEAQCGPAGVVLENHQMRQQCRTVEAMFRSLSALD